MHEIEDIRSSNCQ